MMAKDPGDRYKAPAGVAVALAPFCQGGGETLSIEQFRPEGAVNVRALLGAAGEPNGHGNSPAKSKPAAVPPGKPGGAERRAHPRRSGNPISVLVTTEENADEPLRGFVLNYSAGGLGLLVEDALEVDTVVRVRPEGPLAGGPWVPVRVVYCLAERVRWRVGCQFLNTMSWGELRKFA
jgi:hypothetical protein